MGADRRVLRLRSGKAAGIATSGSLLAAAVCLVVLVSAFVAFDAWPEGANSNPNAEVRLAAPPSADGPAAPVAESSRRARPERRTRRTRTRKAARRIRLSTRVGSGSAGQPRARRLKSPSVSFSAPASPKPASPAPKPERTLVRGTARQVASTVRKTGRTAGGTVGGVSPVAGEIVTGTTGEVADAVDSAASLLP